MPDINLLKNTEKYDPTAPKPVPPAGPGPLSDPNLEPKGLGKFFGSFFNRRPKATPTPLTPTLGKAVGNSGRMSLGRAGGDDRILEEKKSKPAMIQLPDEEESGFNINLLGQDQGQAITLRQQLMKLGLVMLGSLAAVGVVYFGLVFYAGTLTTDIDQTQAKITVLRTEITALEKSQDEVAATTKKITAIRSLIDRHVHWSKFFRNLEQITGPEIFYGTAFAGNLNGSLTLAGRAPTFDALATQYLFFQQAVQRGGFISSFSITAATQRETKTGREVAFSVALQVVPEVFYLTADEASPPPSTTPPTSPPATNTNTSTNP